MNVKEVMQQALEFVEFCWRDVPMNAYAADKRDAIEAALREAIAQPEQKANFCFRCGKLVSAIHDIHTCTPPVGHTN